ncbi:RNA-directed DNA polymerase, eukaryota, partial [Tanacetum coccineum]
MALFRSKEDQITRLSKSIFVTNFPDATSSQDLWNLCQSYGTVVDVYIPNRRSKAGKRFAFVRFINVDNIERLVGNLCTLWIGKMHLQANVVRFERSPLQSSRPPPPPKRPAPPAPSYISAAKGKIYVIRAKEIFVWSPSFIDIVENDYTSDNDVEIDSGVKHSAPVHQVNSGEESKDEVISETFFSENADTVGEANISAHKVSSHDPFNIYDLLHKKPKAVEKEPTSSSIPFPPGFTPEGGTPVQNAHKTQEDHDQSVGKSNGCSSRIAECTQKVDEQLSSKSFDNDRKKLEGGSILGILEEMIKVGQTMGFSMDGCANDMEKIIGTQGVDGETKSDNISDMAIKNLWGNSLFEDVVSEANGNSGGILCVWDPRFFHKDHHIISDNFIALYGTWSPNQTKLLLISVYAPQAVSLKRILWSYLTSLINRWNGECIVMGDFNEVRRKEDRWGTSFNVFGTRVFNQFISSAGLVEIQLEGYNFTWAHPSASKMSKLDRFLVSDGLLSIFP